MEIKTSLHLNIDLRLDSDSAQPADDLALRQLAAVCEGLRLLLRSQTVSQETLAEGGDTAPALPAITATDNTPPIEQAKGGAEADVVAPPRGRRQMPASRTWSFEQFDAAVRAEIRRLGQNGNLPTGSIWDRERSPDLPSLTGVMRRYGCKNMAEFEEKLQAAGSARNGATNGANGVAGRHL